MATDSEGFDECRDIHHTTRTLDIHVRVIHPNMPWSDDLYVAPLLPEPHFDSTQTEVGAVTFVIFSYQEINLYFSIFLKLKVQKLDTPIRFVKFNFEVLG